MAAFEAWLVFLILVVNVVGELQRKRTLAASRGFLAAARLSCWRYWALSILQYPSRKRIYFQRGPRPKKVTEGPGWLRYATD